MRARHLGPHSVHSAIAIGIGTGHTLHVRGHSGVKRLLFLCVQQTYVVLVLVIKFELHGAIQMLRNADGSGGGVKFSGKIVTMV